MRKVLLLSLLLLLSACQSESRKNLESLKKVELITPSGESIQTRLAVSLKQQEQGLSGIKETEFGDTEGMLFLYDSDGEKYFWMPDTHFDLDLIYLDKSLNVIDIIRKLPHYKGRSQPELIPRARPVWARHVLEMKSSSKVSSSLKVGDQLKWKGSNSLQEIEKILREN